MKFCNSDNHYTTTVNTWTAVLTTTDRAVKLKSRSRYSSFRLLSVLLDEHEFLAKQPHESTLKILPKR